MVVEITVVQDWGLAKPDDADAGRGERLRSAGVLVWFPEERQKTKRGEAA